MVGPAEVTSACFVTGKFSGTIGTSVEATCSSCPLTGLVADSTCLLLDSKPESCRWIESKVTTTVLPSARML